MRKNKKSSLKLIDYSFERVDVSFPSFPSGGRPLKIMRAYGTLRVYHHKRRENVSAIKWEAKVRSSRSGTKPTGFAFQVVIVGEFDHGFGLSHSKMKQLLVKEGVPILFDIVSSALAKIMNHSTLRTNVLKEIDLKKLEYSKTRRH